MQKRETFLNYVRSYDLSCKHFIKLTKYNIYTKAIACY